MVTEQLYRAPYLGKLNSKVYNLLGGILKKGALDSLDGRIEAEASRDTLPIPQLVGAITAVGVDQFLQKPTSSMEYFGPIYVDTLLAATAAVNSLICDRFVRSILPSDTCLITWEEMEDAIISMPVAMRENLRISTRTLPVTVKTMGDNTLTLRLPNAFIARKFEAEKAVVECCKYRIYDSSFNAEGMLSQWRKMFQEPNSYQTLQRAANSILFGKWEGGNVSLPNPAMLKPKLVASYQSTIQPDHRMTENFSQVICAGMPRKITIEAVTVFVLGVKTGMIPRQQNWQDYFKEVEPTKFGE